MLIILSKGVLIIGSLLMLLAVMYPVYVIALYTVFRPMLQPLAFLQFKAFGLPIAFPFAAIIIVFGAKYMVTRKEWVLITDKSGLLVSFMLLALLTSVLSVDYMASLTGVIKLLVPLFVLNITYNAIKSAEDIDILLAALMISAVVPLMVGFYQSYSGNYDFLHDGLVDRVSSVFGVGNAYGIFLSIITAANVVLLLRAKNRHLRTLYIAMLVGILVSQVLSLNRGTWLALTAGFIIAATRYRKYVSFKWISVLIIFIIIFFSKTIIDRFDELENRDRFTERNTLEGRVAYWGELATLIAEKPLTGYGVGTADTVTLEYLGAIEAPHNDFIRLALEVGLIGSLLYLLFLIKIAIYFYTRPVSQELWKYNYALIMLSVYFIIISTTQNIVYNQVNFPAFLIMVAVGIKINKLQEKKKSVSNLVMVDSSNSIILSDQPRTLGRKRDE